MRHQRNPDGYRNEPHVDRLLESVLEARSRRPLRPLNDRMPGAREFSRMGEFSNFPFAVLDERAHTTYVNAAFEDLCGYAGGEIVGRNPWTLLRGEETSQSTLDFMKIQMSKRLPFETSLQQVGKNGVAFWVGIYVVPFHDDSTGEHFYAAIERELRRVGEPVMSNLSFSSQVGEMLILAGK